MSRMLVSTMDLSVPDNYTTYMAKMTFNKYSDKYYPEVFDEEGYNKAVEE